MISKELTFENLSFSKDAFYLKDFSMTVYQAEVFGIICDHIEERDLIVSLFEGKCRISSGSITFQRKNVSISQFRQVIPSSLTFIRKKRSLIDNMSAAENICLFQSKNRLINYKGFEKTTRQLLRSYSLDLDLQKKVTDLTEKERITVELLRAVLAKREIVILTGLTSMLNLSDSEEIISLIREIQRKEQITFIFIDIFGDLLFQWANRVLVIRHGITLGCFRSDFLNQQKLYHFFIDKDQKSKKSQLSYPETSQTAPVLSFHDVSTPVLKDLSFTLFSGEILNIYSIEQTSIDEIRNLFYGKTHTSSGEIRFKNKPISIDNTSDMHRLGFAYCLEHAYQTMLIPDMSVRDNILLELSRKMPPIDFSAKYKENIDSQIRHWMMEDLSEKPVRELSFLQRQNLVFLKLYLEYPKVLIIEHPLSDIDLHMKNAAKAWIKNFQERETAIILLTSHTQDLYEFEGDTLYLMKGKTVEEDDIYQALYTQS